LGSSPSKKSLLGNSPSRFDNHLAGFFSRP
jgi:hypothetical protein